MEEDRGSLIDIVEPEDPRIRLKRALPWIMLIVELSITVFLLVYLSFLPEFYYLIFVVFAVLMLGVFGTLDFYAFRHGLSMTIEPINIYSNGVDAFASPFYRLRGLDGFISKDRMDRIEVRAFPYQTQGLSERHGRSGRIGNDLIIVLHTRDRKSRVLGRRSPMTAEKAIETMKREWSIPVVGIWEMDAIEQTGKRR